MSVFLAAARGRSTEVAPIWLMRQAGRYLPEFRALYDRYGLWAMIRTPELAAEATLQPIYRFGLDAAIVFADIMAPLPAMGVEVGFAPGPVVGDPVRDRKDVAGLRVPDPAEIAPFTAEAVRCVRQATGVPVIGFAGAPLTVAAYLVSPDPAVFRGWLREHPELAHELLDKITEVTIGHLRAQVGAGAGAVQLFESGAGALDVRQYGTFGLPYARRVLAAVSGVPRIFYALDAAHLLPVFAGLPAEVAGTDWRYGLGHVRSALPGKVLQGNLDPAVLLCPPEVLTRAAGQVLADGLGGPHIFNLGHGVLPLTPPDAVARLADSVRAFPREPR